MRPRHHRRDHSSWAVAKKPRSQSVAGGLRVVPFVSVHPMKSNRIFRAVLTGLAAFAQLAGVSTSAQETPAADPRIASWWVPPSGRYARLYENDAARAAGAAVTSWSRGQGTQSIPSYAGVMQVSFSAEWVYVRSSGLGYHVMGPWYLNAGHTQLFPNFPANTNVLYRFPRTPVVPDTKTLTGGGPIGYFVDGVALFDNRDTFSYVNASGVDAEPMNGQRGDAVWNRDAFVNEGVTFDAAFAHQAGPTYHYHANAPALRQQLGDHVDFDPAEKRYVESSAAATRHSPILGWVADGYPLYGPYGYDDPMNPASGVRRMRPGYVKRDGTRNTTNLAATGRTTLPAWAARAQNRGAALPSNLHGPAVNATFNLGRYLEDYDYLGNLGFTAGADFDLDVHNGRFCVTPEYPQGTYAYFMAIEADGTPKFPYNIGRWFHGRPSGGAVNAINEPVVEHARGGQAAPIIVTATATSRGVVVSWSSVEGATYAVATSGDGVTFTPLAAGLTSAGLTTTHTTTTTAGYYRVTLTALANYDARGTGGLRGLNGAGTVRHAGVAVAATGTARLVNLSTRVHAGGSAGTPISGFTLGGTGNAAMVIRAIGPTLTNFGVSAPLADPALSVVSGTTTLGSNDDWSAGDATAMAASGAFALNAASRDAAVVATLPAGGYSAPVGAKGGSGVTLLEVYAPGTSTAGVTLTNASTRAFVGTGEQMLLPGFVIEGTGALQLLVRAIGPSLTKFGVSGSLGDPQLTLFQGTTPITTNDNWEAGQNAGEIESAATRVGAFALPGGSRDAAVLVTLPAGAYTAAVSDVAGGTGTALVELYVVP